MVPIILGALGLAKAGYDAYAANENANYQRRNLRKSNKLAVDQRNAQVARIDQSYTKGLGDIAKSRGNSLASLASQGIIGAGAKTATGAMAAEQTADLETMKANALQDIAFQDRQRRMQYQSAIDQIEAGRVQGFVNAGFGAAGAVAGAAGGVIDQLTQDPNAYAWMGDLVKNIQGDMGQLGTSLGQMLQPQGYGGSPTNFTSTPFSQKWQSLEDLKMNNYRFGAR